MGGPGASFEVCSFHLQAIATRLRALRENQSIPPAILGDLAFDLSEAKLALSNASEEFSSIGRYVDRVEHQLHELSNRKLQCGSGGQVASGAISDDAARLWFQLVVAGSDKGFRSLDTFVGWFVGGTGAAIGLILANIDQLGRYLRGVDLTAVTWLVVLAFASVVSAKFLGSLICTMAGASEKAAEIAARIPSEANVSIEDLIAAKRLASPWPARLAGKVLPETAIGLAKLVSWMLMAAGLFAIVAAVLVGVAWTSFAIGVNFNPAP